MASEAEIQRWYSGTDRTGIGVICGAVSGGLEMLEFEGRAVDEGLHEQFLAAAHASGLGELVRRIDHGYLETTPGGGYHLFYRCSKPLGQKLAERPATPEELKAEPKAKLKTLIETKGEGGYAITAPSNGTVHPTGIGWHRLRGGWDQLANLTAQEHEALLNLARSFDQLPAKAHRPPVSPEVEGGRPGDVFNERGKWDEDVLEPAGWKCIYERSGVTYWQRPGKQEGISASLGHAGHDVLYVFSTSTPFPDVPAGYEKFTAYAYLRHDGDFTAAAKELFEQGYQPEPEGPLEKEVDKEYRRLVVRERARERWRYEQEAAAFQLPPSENTLADELALPEPAKLFTISDLHPTGGNTLLAASYKVGKTTLLANLLRSLLDGEPFLGEHGVTKPDGRVAFWNYEVGRDQFRRWLKSLGIRNADDGAVWNLRGYRLPLQVPSIEDIAVQWLTSRAVTVLIVDPFSRAYGGEENSNTEVGKFLEALDVIKRRADVVDLFLAAHMGRQHHEDGTEHVRGATRLDDWPDVRWLYRKGEDETAEVRYFRADGRDVSVPERSLAFDPETRRLLVSGGSLREDLAQKYVTRAVEAARDEPGIGKTALKSAIGGKAETRDGHIRQAAAAKFIENRGTDQKHAWFITQAGETFLSRRVSMP